MEPAADGTSGGATRHRTIVEIWRQEQGLKQLRQLTPDLADRVEDEADKLTLDAAIEEYSRQAKNTEAELRACERSGYVLSAKLAS